MATNSGAIKKKSDPKNCSEGRSWFTFLRSTGMGTALQFLMGFLFPGSCGQSSDGKNIVVTFPCKPTLKVPKPRDERVQEKYIPIGLITKNKDVDLIGGKLIHGCKCGLKNGLDPDCRRISCQNNPGCYMNPPRCWPQIKEPPPPPPQPPDQPMFCLPLNLVYYDPKSGKS